MIAFNYYVIFLLIDKIYFNFIHQSHRDIKTQIINILFFYVILLMIIKMWNNICDNSLHMIKMETRKEKKIIMCFDITHRLSFRN